MENLASQYTVLVVDDATNVMSCASDTKKRRLYATDDR